MITHPDRKFMYVEMYYFHKWWTDTRTPALDRENLKTLIARGQWEFVEGGWVMPDEANPTYSALADQLTEGHLFLNRTFGITPKIGYQIDPFGASTAVAQLYQRAGFKYHILDRIDYNLKNKLTQEKALEFKWTPIAGSSETLFTHILDNNYCMPMIETFDFEGNPWVNPPINDLTLAARSLEYALLVRQRHGWYRSKHVLVLHQCDFAYQNPKAQFDNMELIIGYLNKNRATYNMTLHWSTLGEYFESLHDVPSSSWPTKTDQSDYFPYADIPSAWWTGYYTSRPLLKGLVRDAEVALRTTGVIGLPLFAGKMISDVDTYLPTELHRAHAVAQHHDAVAGTEKAFVAEHYAQLLQDGRDAAQKINLALLSIISGSDPNKQIWTNSTDQLRDLQPGQAVTIMAFNPLFTDRNEVFQVPVWSWKDITINGSNGQALSRNDYAPIANVDPRDIAVSPATLFINANVPSGGWATYTVIRHRNDIHPDPSIPPGLIQNQFVRVSVDPNTGLLNGLMTHLNVNPKAYTISQNLMYYQSYPGPGQPSGAYIFQPIGDAQPLANKTVQTLIRTTPFVKEIYQDFGGASQTIRLFSHHQWISLSNWIGPLAGNTELVSRWNIPFAKPDFRFNYDNNGWVTQAADRVEHDAIIAGNYKPSVYTASTGNFGAIFSSDRAHGVSSAEIGTFEMMLHRRLLQDDWRGLDEAMNDTSVINPKMRVTFCEGCSPTKAQEVSFNATYGLNFPIQLFVNTPGSTFSAGQYAPLRALPAGLHASQVRVLSRDQLLITISALWTPKQGTTYDVLQLSRQFKSASRTSLTGMHTIERASTALYRTGDMHTFIVHF